MKMLSKVPIAILMAVVILGGSAGVSSALTLTMSYGNTALLPYPVPFGTVDVTRVDATHATLTFTSNLGPTGGYQYAFGDGSIADYNLADVGNVTSSVSSYQAAPWGTTDDSAFPGLTGPGSGQVDGFGVFNRTWDRHDGLGYTLSEITFDLVRTSGTWSSDTDILTPNASGFSVATHIFVVSEDDWTQAVATGYAADGPRPIPEPSSLLPVISGLLGLGALGFRRRSKA